MLTAAGNTGCHIQIQHKFPAVQAAVNGVGSRQVGNEVRIVGSLQYYEAGGTWQVSDLNYRAMKPKDPGNIQKISEGNTPAYRLTTAERYLGEVTITTDEEEKTYPYAQLALNTSLSMENLYVKDIYTTTNPDSASKGAMTLTCTTCWPHIRFAGCGRKADHRVGIFGSDY